MISMLAPVIAGTVKTLAMSLFGEKLLIKVVLLLLERLVDSTDNDLDNQILAAYKAQLVGKL